MKTNKKKKEEKSDFGAEMLTIDKTVTGIGCFMNF
jgi:hypothetical protein